LIAKAFSKPQLEHLSFSEAPHSPQNFTPLAFSKPQARQRIDGTALDLGGQFSARALSTMSSVIAAGSYRVA
jgi:hypothetical protein